MLDISCYINVTQFIKSAHHFNIICRKKGHFGEFLSIDWSFCTVEVIKAQSLI